MRNGNGSRHAEPGIGRSLELARRERGLSLDQVQQETKIRARYLRELELENFDALPAVYMQGSLKTYANFLGLDGEALTRELRRRQGADDEPVDPTTHSEPPKSDLPDWYLAARGAADAESGQIGRDEDDVGGAALAGHNYRLYLVSGVFLILILVAAALMLTLARDSQRVVIGVRDPLISQAPYEPSRVDGEENEPAYQQGDKESDTPQPEQSGGSLDEGVREDGETAQGPRAATAASSAPPATATATAEPETQPAPAASESTDQESEAQPAPVATATATTEPETQPAPAASESTDQGNQDEETGGQRVEEPPREEEGPIKGFSITR